MRNEAPKNKVISLRVSQETNSRIEQLAKATKRSKAFLFDEAINAYLAKNEWQIKAIQEGLDEAQSPDAKWIDHEALEAKYGN